MSIVFFWTTNIMYSKGTPIWGVFVRTCVAWCFAVRQWCEVFWERVGHQWHCPLQSKNLSQCTLVETGEVWSRRASLYQSAYWFPSGCLDQFLDLKLVLASHWPHHVALQLLHSKGDLFLWNGDFTNEPLKGTVGYKWPPRIGDKKLTNWITWFRMILQWKL